MGLFINVYLLNVVAASNSDAARVTMWGEFASILPEILVQVIDPEKTVSLNLYPTFVWFTYSPLSGESRVNTGSVLSTRSISLSVVFAFVRVLPALSVPLIDIVAVPSLPSGMVRA